LEPGFNLKPLERFENFCALVGIVQGVIYFHLTDEDLSAGTLGGENDTLEHRFLGIATLEPLLRRSKGGIMSDPGIQTAAATEIAGLSQVERVTNIFTAPSKTFQDIKRGNKSWWMPFIIVSIVGYIFFAAMYTKIGMQQVVDNQIRMDPKTSERIAQMPPDQRAVSNKISVGVTEGVFIGTPAIVLLVGAVISLILWPTINFVFAGKATYGSVFVVWVFSTLPSIVKTLLGTVVIFAGVAPESFNIKNFAPTNLGAFMNPLETNKALYTLATSLDLVSIWSMVVLSIGLAIVAGVKRNSGYIAVLGWWVIVVLVSVGWAAMMG